MSAKIAIIGAGSVGATLAYACLLRGVGKHLALYDVNAAKLRAEVLDLSQGLQFVPIATVEGGDDVAVCRGAAVVVVTAGAKQKPGQSRMDLASANVQMLRTLLPKVLDAAPDALLLMVSNPVDVLTYAAIKLSGLPPRRVMGSGTVLDSSRFRWLIGQRLKVAVQSVHALIVGEHGESEVPLWSSARVANVPLHEWAVMGHGKLTVRDRGEIFQGVKDSAQEIIQGKGATNYAIGLAAARILEAILHDENRVLPVSSLMTNYLAGLIDDVCLSVPCIVNARGIDAALPVPLNEAESAGLRNSAETLRAGVKALGF